jgi:hypothetical protein
MCVCMHTCMYTCDVGSLFAYVCVNVTVVGSLLFVLVLFVLKLLGYQIDDCSSFLAVICVFSCLLPSLSLL